MTNTIVNKYLSILILICFGFGQDEYPNFSDPLKQLAFERKRIYVYDDKIQQNNQNLTEIEFLKTINLENEAEKILNSQDYYNRLEVYNTEYELSKETYIEIANYKLGWLGRLYGQSDMTVFTEATHVVGNRNGEWTSDFDHNFNAVHFSRMFMLMLAEGA